MPTSKLGQRLLGLAIGLASHSIAFLFGFIAGRLVQPSEAAASRTSRQSRSSFSAPMRLSDWRL